MTDQSICSIEFCDKPRYGKGYCRAPVFADASHDGGEFDGVTGLYLHSEYLAREAQEAR